MKSLRFQLTFSHLLPLLLVLPVVGIAIVYLVETQVLLANITNEITRQAVLVADYASTSTQIWLDPKSAETFAGRVGANIAAKFMLLDTEGRLMASSDPTDSAQVGEVIYKPGDLEKQAADSQDQSSGPIKNMVVPVITRGGSLIGFVRFENPLAAYYQRSLQLRQVTEWVLGGGLLAGLILGWVLATNLSRQLRTATTAVVQLSGGETLEPLKEQGPTEIRLLYRAFNSLVYRLKTLEENRKRLLANLVHELGRPIGAMQSAVQAMIGGAYKDESLRGELLEGIVNELRVLNGLINELARLREQVTGSLELEKSFVALSEWLTRTAAPYREEAFQKQLAWVSEIPADLPTVKIDPGRFSSAIGNLLSNAISYSPENGTVKLNASVADGSLLIRVSDTGPGVSLQERDRIFRPFFRGSAAKRFSHGMGLGLTIARDQVEAHGGQLYIEDSNDHGSSFVISLPII